MFVSLPDSCVEAPRCWCWEVGPMGGDGGDSSPIKEAQESSLVLSATRGYKEKSAVRNPEVGHHCVSILSLDFQPSGCEQ